MAIATDPADISRIMPWIQRLDAGGSSTKRRLYNYPVQNGSARDLAASLQLVLGRSDASVGLQQPQQGAAQTLSDIGSPQGTLSGATAVGSSIGAQGLEPSQVVGAETPLPGSGTSDSIPSAGQTAQASDVGPRIVPNDSTNSLLIYADGEDYDFIRQALAELDKPVPQVMIEATLAEVTLTKDLQYGVNWSVLSGNSTFTLKAVRTWWKLLEGILAGLRPPICGVRHCARSATGTLGTRCELAVNYRHGRTGFLFLFVNKAIENKVVGLDAHPLAGLMEPGSNEALSASVSWVARLLTGSIATSACVLAVATIGVLMLLVD